MTRIKKSDFGSITLFQAREVELRYGQAQAAAASWRAHDGRRQRGTACPHLFRYHLTHTYCSLARLPPTHPFVGAPILQRHFQVPWRARVPPPRVLLPHTCTQDGWFLQPKRRPARLPCRTGEIHLSPSFWYISAHMHYFCILETMNIFERLS